MKSTKILVAVLVSANFFAGCQNSTSFKKTKSGLVYKIFPGKDTTGIRTGNIIKFHVTQKINDSVVFDSYKKMPEFTRVDPQTRPYDPSEVYTMLKKGDSLVTVQMMDTFIKKSGARGLPPQFKNGDRITTSFKILNVFKNPDDAKKDQEKEYATYLPIQQKEMEELRIKTEAEAKKDLVGQAKEMEKFLAAKNITAQKTPLGAYVSVKQPGTGASVDSGKYVTVKYSGKHLDTDSVFQASSTTTQINGPVPSIKGFEDGLKLFKKGGSGTIYIPGALGYGKTPPQGSPFKPNEALIFDVEITNVTDTAPEPPARMNPRPKN
jgi:FKBP-type peptidyl-prolyl cis-trans isomerase FkpA